MNQSFFIEPRKASKADLKERKRIHQKQIIEIYKGWRESHFNRNRNSYTK
jgi:hypothetical protein